MTRAAPITRAAILVGLLLPAVAAPDEALGQFSAPCGVECALTLGATGFTAATGTVVAIGRINGISTIRQGLWAWGTGFTVVVGGGIALSGNGARQRRAVYGAGAGSLSGAVLGLAIESVRTRGDGPRVLAGALVGAAVGSVVGGVYGALSYDEETASGPVPLFSVRLPL